jgi:O-antigen ligase
VNNAILSAKYLFTLLSGLFVLAAGAAAFTESYFLFATPFVLLLFYTGWHYREFIFLLLLFSLPFSFEYSFSSSLGTDVPDELLMLLVTILFLLWWFYKPSLLPLFVIQHPVLLFLILLFTWTGIAVLFSSDQLISLKYLLAKGWYAGAFVLAPLILFRQKKNLYKALITLTVALLIVMFIVLIRHSTFGFSFATVNDAVYPFFRNHVNYSAMLVCLLPLLSGYYMLTKNRTLKNVLMFLVLIVLAALFFSYARGAWAAVFAGAATYWLIKKKLMVYAYLAGILIIIAALFWIKSEDRYLYYAHDYKTTIFHKDFGEHLIATYKLKDVSTAERFYRWIAGVRMIKDNWLTGYGPNTFYSQYKPYAVPAYKTWVSDNKDRSTVHNYFLLTAIEQGIPGLFFLLLLIGSMFYYAQHLYYRVKDTFYQTIAIMSGVVLAMVVVVNFLSDLVETDKIGSIFFLTLSLLVITDINTRHLEKSDSSPDIQGIS